MPFELIPYRPRGRPPVTVEEVDHVVSAIGGFKKMDRGDGKIRWVYKNQDTGVYFLVAHSPDKTRQSYPEWNDSQLSVTVGLGKPSFFGIEAFPVISQLLKNLNLGVLDTQNTAMYRHPARLTDEQMRGSWGKCNASEIEALLASKKPLVTAPREKLDFFWRYMKLRPNMQDSLGSDVLVPPINLHRAKDGSVKMSCIWPDASKVALPEVDFVMVTREEKKLLSKKKISGAVPYSKIASMLKSRSQMIKEPVRHMLFNSTADKDLLDQLSMLDLRPPTMLPKLSPDEIVETRK